MGDGPFLAQMKQALAHSNVVFTGFLFDVALSAAYASSDILVFPSTTDTLGSVVVEAMASGVPVIVSDRGGACELAQHGRTGLVAKGRNAQGMLAAIEHLLDHAELRRQMSSDCRSYAEGCGWENAYANFWNSQSGPEIGAVSGAAAVVARAAAGER